MSYMTTKNIPTQCIVHHTAVSRAKAPVQFDAVNRYHQSQWGESIKSSLGYYGGYHYLIEPSGVVKQYRRDTEMGAHAVGQNDKSIGICLTGNFDIEFPTTEQSNALRDLLRVLIVRHGLSYEAIYPHRKYARKTCYGSNLMDSWARDLARLPTGTDQKHEQELLAKVSKLDIPRDVLLRVVRALLAYRTK
jgi:N-acetylmuramoyl-L-alanine amidase